MGVRVYIATTEGPALIQRVAAEESDIPPVVCLNGTTETLPISDAYGRFVRRGSGIVAKLTGHDSYRIDLDRGIDGGSSWQLGVLLAHLLMVHGRLAGPRDPADIVIFATGEVDRDLLIRPVGHIDRKVAACQATGDVEAAGGARCLFLVPAGDGPIDPATTAIASLEEAAALLSISLPGGTAAPALPSAPATKEGGFSGLRAVLGVGIVLALGAGLYAQRDRIATLWQDPIPASPPQSSAAPVLEPPETPDQTGIAAVTVQALLAPAGFSCPSLRFAQLDLVPGEPVPLSDGQVLEGQGATCMLRYRFDGAGLDEKARTGDFEMVWQTEGRTVKAAGAASAEAPLILEVDWPDQSDDSVVLTVSPEDGRGDILVLRHRITR
ncbi:hypothetical protein [Pacificispira sp.]|uniref:hypothetical protein n=1 Tax=Pacificispira sp. TaxID=2888761 RepID=UPI003BAA5004